MPATAEAPARRRGGARARGMVLQWALLKAMVLPIVPVSTAATPRQPRPRHAAPDRPRHHRAHPWPFPSPLPPLPATPVWPAGAGARERSAVEAGMIGRRISVSTCPYGYKHICSTTSFIYTYQGPDRWHYHAMLNSARYTAFRGTMARAVCVCVCVCV